MTEPEVHVYVASYNTAEATELCVRSLREYAGIPYRLTVGDAGSTDGSVDMLRRFEQDGWLALEEHPGRLHAEWLNDWIRRDGERYVLFSDSDIEYLQPGVLGRMAAVAAGRDAAIVFSEHLPAAANFVHPRSGDVLRLAARPAPWLVLIDRDRARDIGVGFDEHVEQPAPFPEGGIVYDVGARFFAAVCAAGGRAVRMPASFRLAYRHYGGQSWLPDEGEMARKKARDQRLIRRRLEGVRRAQAGDRLRARVDRAVVDAGAAATWTWFKAQRLRDPEAVRRKLRALAAAAGLQSDRGLG
jgi:hypothetical protein